MSEAIARLDKLDRLCRPFGIELGDEAEALAAVWAAAHATANDDAVETLRVDIMNGDVKADDVPARFRAAALAISAKTSARAVLTDVSDGVSRWARRWFAANGDIILGQLRPTFDDAAGRLTKALETVGSHDLTYNQQRQGGAVVKAWQTREETLETITAIRAIRMTLAGSGYGADVEQAEWWIADAVTVDDLDAQRELLGGFEFDVVAFLAAGYRLALNSPARADEVRVAAVENTARREADRKAARIAADPAIALHNQRVEREVADMTGRPA